MEDDEIARKDNSSSYKGDEVDDTEIDYEVNPHDARHGEQDEVTEDNEAELASDDAVHAGILYEALQCVDGCNAEDGVESVIGFLDAEEDDTMAADVEQIDTNIEDETLLGAVAEQMLFSSHFQKITADKQDFSTTHNIKSPEVRLILPIQSLLLTVEYRCWLPSDWGGIH